MTAALGPGALPHEQKRALRWMMRRRLQLIRPGESRFLRDRLRDNLAVTVSRFPGVWASYLPLPEEADPAVEVGSAIEWVFPRVVDNRLVFCRGRNFVTGRWGVREPGPQAEVVPTDALTGLVVPGLAFDRAGGRLGRGKGYYDRTLAGFRGLTVGVGFSVQLTDRVPCEPWDRPLRAIVTDASVYWGGQ